MPRRQSPDGTFIQFSFSYFSNYYITFNLVVACNVGNIWNSKGLYSCFNIWCNFANPCKWRQRILWTCVWSVMDLLPHIHVQREFASAKRVFLLIQDEHKTFDSHDPYMTIEVEVPCSTCRLLLFLVFVYFLWFEKFLGNISFYGWVKNPYVKKWNLTC